METIFLSSEKHFFSFLSIPAIKNRIFMQWKTFFIFHLFQLVNSIFLSSGNHFIYVLVYLHLCKPFFYLAQTNGFYFSFIHVSGNHFFMQWKALFFIFIHCCWWKAFLYLLVSIFFLFLSISASGIHNFSK